jgi:hypothetical protein
MENSTETGKGGREKDTGKETKDGGKECVRNGGKKGGEKGDKRGARSTERGEDIDKPERQAGNCEAIACDKEARYVHNRIFGEESQSRR